MTQHTPLAWAALAAAALVFGMSKAGIPGLGILGIPLVALVIPGTASTGVVLPMLIVGDLFAVGLYRREVRWGQLWRLLPWAVAGILAGTWVLKLMPKEALRPVIGAIVLGLLALHLWRKHSRAPVPTHPAVAAATGFSGGVTTMMANAAGPIMSLYLLAMRLPKEAFLGTAAWYFLLVNWIKVPFMVRLDLINADSLRLNLILLPGILLGILLGVLVARRLPERGFAVVVEVLTAAAAVPLLLPQGGAR